MNWKEVYCHLKDNGIDVYSVGQHVGMCKTPYAVLRNNGAVNVGSRVIQDYEILLYYPVDQYSEFENYVERVKKIMNHLYPAMKLVEDQQPHYMDNNVKAYMTGLEYQTQRINNINRAY